jgi:hypothetical protein
LSLVPIALWTVIGVASSYYVFTFVGPDDNFLVVATSMMLLSPFIVLGTLIGYARVGLSVGLFVVAFYLCVYVAVNVFWVKI